METRQTHFITFFVNGSNRSPVPLTLSRRGIQSENLLPAVLEALEDGLVICLSYSHSITFFVSHSRPTFNVRNLMTNITAVARLYHKNENADDETTQLLFNADYDDERNHEWSKWTPSLSLNLNVLNSVADQFELQANYILTFEKQES
jgi:hypothetical protein